VCNLHTNQEIIEKYRVQSWHQKLHKHGEDYSPRHKFID
jgi:hypothetical protein